MIGMEKWMEIKSLKNKGLSISEIARNLNINRKTVYKNLKKENIPRYKRPKIKSKIDPYKIFIDEKLKKYNLSAQKLFQIITRQGYAGSYSLVSKYVKKVKKDYKTQAVMRFETLPGEQAQVDWGSFGEFHDNEQKKVIKLYCFFMILGFSRTLFIQFFERQDTKHFLLGHNMAFKYFGGYTNEILYDNLKSVVIKRKIKVSESEYNKKFMDFAGYYGFKPILCRPYKPNTKGKVENSVNFVKDNFFKGESFHSLKQINEEAMKWLEEKNNRLHRTTMEKPFDRLKREGLNSMENKKLYDLVETEYRKVFSDCRFHYEGNFYSCPPKYVGKEISIKRIEKDKIEFSYRGEAIDIHKLSKGKRVDVVNEIHFEGLKELRQSHPIIRPEKKKKLDLQELEHVSQMFEGVSERDLNRYEEASCPAY